MRFNLIDPTTKNLIIAFPDEKVIEQVIKTFGKDKKYGELYIYRPNFVVYKKETRKNTIYRIKNLHTNEIRKMKYVTFEDFDYYLYLHDLQRKRIKKIWIGNGFPTISSDFYVGKTPFFYVEYTGKSISRYPYCFCLIYKKYKEIGIVDKNYRWGILGPSWLYRDTEEVVEPEEKVLHETLCMYSDEITEKTQYISSINNDWPTVKFYRLTKDGLKLVDKLKLDSEYFYEINFASCSSKFVICARNWKDKKYIMKTFLYDVSTKTIEYENDTSFYFDNEKMINTMERKFLMHLLAYAHGFQDSYFHALRNFRDEIVLMPIERWNAYKKLSKELAKGFSLASKKPRTSPSLRI